MMDQTTPPGPPPADPGPEAPPGDERRQQIRWTALAMAAVVVAVIVALGWLLFGGPADGPGGERSELPLIKAETTPYKVRPESPGGLEVPDRDKLVYGRIGGDDAPPPVERLLPPPEAPKPPPSAEAPPPEPPADEPPLSVAAAATESGVPTIEEVLNAKPPPAPPKSLVAATESAPPPAAKPVAATPSANGFEVQLAALRSSKQADAAWKRLGGRHADVLGRLDHRVVRADLGAKGVFYRLRVGPVASADDAKALCAILSERKVDCLVVRPGT